MQKSTILFLLLQLLLHSRVPADTSYYIDFLQIQGKFYLRIDRLGEGAKWRRTLGQEIYSPLLLAFSEQVNYKFYVDFNPWRFKCLGDHFIIVCRMEIIGWIHMLQHFQELIRPTI